MEHHPAHKPLFQAALRFFTVAVLTLSVAGLFVSPAMAATPPVINFPGANPVSVNENAWVLLDTTATVTDDGTVWTGGILSVQVTGNAYANDQLQVQNQGTGATQVGVSGADVTYGGVTIGTVAGQNSSSLSVTFNASAITTSVRAVVRRIRFNPTDDNTSSLQRTVTYTLSDGVDGTSTPKTKLINVTPVNDFPNINGWASSDKTYTENAAPIILDTNVTINDPDINSYPNVYNFASPGAALTVTITNATSDSLLEDQLGIRNQGTLAGQIGVSGANVTYESTVIGTVSTGTTPTTQWLTVSFNTSASNAAAQALARNLTYENLSENPNTFTRLVQLSTTDGAAGDTSLLKNLFVVAVDDFPNVNGWSGADKTYTENAAPIILDTDVTINDPDVPNLASGSAALTVTITANVSADDRLGIRNQGAASGQIGVSGSDVTYGGTSIGTISSDGVGSNPLTVSFNTNASDAAAQALARNLTYWNVSENPSTATRLVVLSTTDGTAGDTSNPKNLFVVAVDDKPDINNWWTPDVTYTENAAAIILDTNVTINDPDVPNLASGSAALTVTITANVSADDRLGIRNQGTGAGQIGVSGIDVTYGRMVIGSFSGGMGSTPLTVSFNTSASNAAAQALARNLTYWNVSDNPSTLTRSVQLSTTDGSAGDTSLLKNLFVNALNDPPVTTSGGAFNVPENTTTVTTVTATDPDSPTPNYSILPGGDAAKFSIDSSTGVLTFVAAPDFEVPTDVNTDNVYDLTVQVSDGLLTDTQAISVTVTNTDEIAPSVTSILRYDPATSPTNFADITFRITFNEDVQSAGMDLADFTLSLTDTATGTLNTVTWVSDSVYDVAVTGVAGNGTLSLGFAAGNNIADLAGNALGASPVIGTNENYTIDNTAISVMNSGVVAEPGTLTVTDGGSYQTHFTSIEVTFNSDAYNPADDIDQDDVTNPDNYLLLQPGPNGVYDTEGCGMYKDGGHPTGDDVQIPTGPVAYDNNSGAGPFVATVTVNQGIPLPSGEYRLFICGQTSITDLAGNHLGGGVDTVLTFRITDPVVIPPTPAAAAGFIPVTGFAPDRMTVLPPPTTSYTAMGDLWLEIPRLGVQMNIVGVPQANGEWDVSWLGQDAGWLQGSAFPTWAGNSVLTGHVWNADNTAGPFRYINTLWYGDKVIIHAWGAQYVYEVRSVQQVGPGSTAAMLKHEELPWVTLVTCRGYDEATNSYRYRVLVRAVLVEVK